MIPQQQREPLIKIVSFMAFETGTYNQVFDRPYTTNLTPDSLNRYDELTKGGRLINPGTLSTLAPMILAPSATAGTAIVIPNGWDQKRYRFVMIVEQKQGVGGAVMHIMTGYTDHNEAVGTNTNHINPAVRLFFNTCVSVNVIQNMATLHHNASAHGRITDHYHILHRPVDVSPIRGFTSDGPVSLRPSDVVDQMSVNERSLMGTTHSLCNGLMSEPVIRSSRAFNAAPTYLAETLQAINYSAKLHEGAQHENGTTMYDSAIGTLQEDTLRREQFMQMLISRTSFSRDGCVSWGELRSMFPYIETPEVTQFKKHDPNRIDVMINRAGGTEYWSGATSETSIAARIAAAVPSAMISSLVGVAQFHITNMNNRGFEVAVNHALPLVKIVSIDMISAVEQLKKQIIIDIFNAVSDNNRIPIEASIRCDVMGDLFISLQFNCQPKVDFTLPAFADHLFTPILARTRAKLDNLAHDMSQLAGVSTVHNAQVATNPHTGQILPLSQHNQMPQGRDMVPPTQPGQPTDQQPQGQSGLYGI